jgi:hypothetical protein
MFAKSINEVNWTLVGYTFIYLFIYLVTWFLSSFNSYSVKNGKPLLKESAVTNLVEHPIQMRPPSK